MVGDTPCISEMSPLPLQLRPNDFEDGPHQNYNTLVIQHCWLELLKRLWKWPFVHYFELLHLFASCVALCISTIIHWCVFLCTFVCFLVFLEISLYIGIYLSISLYICIFHSISLYICIYLSISLYICMFLKAGVCRSLWQLELDTSPPPTSSLPVSRYTRYTLQKHKYKYTNTNTQIPNTNTLPVSGYTQYTLKKYCRMYFRVPVYFAKFLTSTSKSYV